MKFLGNKNKGDKIFSFYYTDYIDYINLSKQDKKELDADIDKIFKLISYNTKQIERCPNDIFLICRNQNKFVGFIHIVPQNFNYENLSNRYDTKNMYVDYIAVNPKYQGQGVATALYRLSARELKKAGTKELNAILFDEYSRKAFCKVMKKNGASLKENALDGSVSVIFEDIQMEK